MNSRKPTTKLIAISIVGQQGFKALAELEARLGPLDGRTPGLFTPCRLERHYGVDATTYVFAEPHDAFQRQGIREAQGSLLNGVSLSVAAISTADFKWSGDESAQKRQAGVRTDLFAPPQLPEKWIEALTTART